MRVDVQRAPDHVTQPRRVQHGAGAQHPLHRQARRLHELAGQHVHRIGDQDDQPGVSAQRRGDPPDDGGIFPGEFEARLRGGATLAGRDHQCVRAAQIVERCAPHVGARQKGHAVRQVHGLAFGDLFARVVQKQFFGDAGMQD